MTTISFTREFVPGSVGWTEDDLADPEIARLWDEGRYEIVEGVLAQMPAAYFAGGEALFNLTHLLKEHMKKAGVPGRIAGEVDIVLSRTRVLVADAVLLMPADMKRQAVAAGARGNKALLDRILVPPTLVIESISLGHEKHDMVLKRAWYAEFGIPHYWIVNAFARRMECLSLHGSEYATDATGGKSGYVRTMLFPDWGIPLAEVWPPL